MRSVARTAVAVLVAAALIAIGLIWDIAWHRSVGRDTFWTPPHMVEYAAAIIVGAGCGRLILRSSLWGTDAERGAMVRFWGFSGPLGAWVAVWGSLAMLVSAPFDNWWHNAYGLDVKIVSPPHMLLGAGMTAIIVGAWLMTLSEQNRTAERHQRFAIVFAVASAILLLMIVTITMEYTGFPNLWRSRVFYLVAAGFFPFVLAAAARSGRLRWPATVTAAIFMLTSLALSWVLQQVAATPKLAPINNPITHLVAAPFPVALIVPAVVFDGLQHRLGTGRDWRLALLFGAGFVVALLAVSWPLSAFLLSPAARNPVFLADQWDFSIRPGPWQYQYWEDLRGGRAAAGGGIAFVRVLLIAALLAAASSRVGLGLGSWMRKVKR
ncbi:MAG TPA: hypothetical protein VGP87_07550 [Gemmatimonadales bacterium]|nr:hypothetical protein [Gemmatimonadales bacterium]